MPHGRFDNVIVMSRLDAVVVGSGPNGLAAAITLAQAGRSVTVLEANDTIGGATRSAELTLPGFVHDLGSAIHPLGVASPFFRSLDLESHGLRWIYPEASVAHPLDDGRAAMAWKDLDRTADGLAADATPYRRFFRYWVEHPDELADFALRPLLRIPGNPATAVRFGALSTPPATVTARSVWKTEEARALFAGHAAHSILPLGAPFTTSFAILLGASAHSVGWPFPQGGAQAIPDALASILRDLGGTIETGRDISSMGDLPDSTAVIFAIGPHQVERIVGDRFPERYRRSLRGFRYGPGAWKVDYALSEPIPWTNPDVHRAGTVHVGGTLDEIVDSERATAKGRYVPPFVLLAQHTLADPTRAPAGKQTAWAYCHVPNGSEVDRTDAIEQQIERFAPGFRDCVLARHVSSPAILHEGNKCLVGGDVGGGSNKGSQLFFRPRPQANPFTTADPQIFLGSASTTPGGGVHGMGGVGAAERALSTILK
jgi:phytoene dehydrogenase-like protein